MYLLTQKGRSAPDRRDVVSDLVADLRFATDMAASQARTVTSNCYSELDAINDSLTSAQFAVVEAELGDIPQVRAELDRAKAVFAANRAIMSMLQNSGI
jgi:hypothetical protein